MKCSVDTYARIVEQIVSALDVMKLSHAQLVKPNSRAGQQCTIFNQEE